jgi:F0F1-type ATP synthase assembly protein I
MTNIKDLDKKIDKLTKRLITKKKNENIIFATCAEFFSGVFVTTLVGYFIDRIFATKYIFVIIFLIAGFLIGFVNIYRLLNKELAKKDEQ